MPTTRCSSHVDQQAATRQIRRPSTARAGKPPPAVQRLRCDLGATRVQRAALERSAPAREKAKGRHRSNRRQVDSFDPMKLNAISGLRNLSLQENPVVESGVQTPDSDPIKEYKECLEYRRL